jgi:uncharacterized protein (AIM24 family)
VLAGLRKQAHCLGQVLRNTRMEAAAAPAAPAAPPAEAAAETTAPLPVESFIYGDEVDSLQLLLQPGASVIGLNASYVSCSRGIVTTSALHRTTALALFRVLVRGYSFAQDTLVHSHSTWTNTSTTPASLGFGTPSCCKIVHLDLAVTGPMVVAVQSLLCFSSTATVNPQWRALAATPRFTGARLSAAALLRVKHVSGTGNLFLAASGMAVSKELQAGESLLVAVDRVVACSASCTVTAVPQQPVQLLRAQLRPQAEFVGPGTVYMQSCPAAVSSCAGAQLNRHLGLTISLVAVLVLLHIMLLLLSTVSFEQFKEAFNTVWGRNANNNG